MKLKCEILYFGVFYLLCYVTILEAADDEKKKSKPKSKGSRKLSPEQKLSKFIDEWQPLILNSSERQKILDSATGSLPLFGTQQTFDIYNNISTPDWKATKRARLSSLNRHINRVVLPRILDPRNKTTRSYYHRARTPYLIFDDAHPLTTRESKRAKKRKLTTNFSYIDQEVDEFFRSMNYSTPSKDKFTYANAIVNQRNVIWPTENVTGTIIFLHGEGFKGGVMREWLRNLRRLRKPYKHIRMVFPTSPRLAFRIAGNELMHVWFQRDDLAYNATEDLESIDRTANSCMNIIRYEMNKIGVPMNRIMLGGFGQGAVMAMHLAYRYAPSVAGVFVIGGFLNKNSIVYSHLAGNQRKRFPEIHFVHGVLDEFIPIKWARKTFIRLRDLGVEGSFRKVPNEEHHMDFIGTQLIFDWIDSKLPDK